MKEKRVAFEGLKKPLTLPIGDVWSVEPPTSDVTEPTLGNVHLCEYT